MGVTMGWGVGSIILGQDITKLCATTHNFRPPFPHPTGWESCAPQWMSPHHNTSILYRSYRPDWYFSGPLTFISKYAMAAFSPLTGTSPFGALPPIRDGPIVGTPMMGSAPAAVSTRGIFRAWSRTTGRSRSGICLTVSSDRPNARPVCLGLSVSLHIDSCSISWVFCD